MFVVNRAISMYVCIIIRIISHWYYLSLVVFVLWWSLLLSSLLLLLQAFPGLPHRRDGKGSVRFKVRKVTNGVSTNGVTAIFMFLTQGPFGYFRWPTCIFPKVPGRTFCLNRSKCVIFAAAPIVSTPFVRNQKVLEKDLRDWAPSTFCGEVQVRTRHYCRVYVSVHVCVYVICNM